MEAALEPDAPLVHDEGNLLVSWHIARGDCDAAMAAADVIVDGAYRTQHVEHAYLEPEAGVGWIDNDVVTVRASTQVIEHAAEIAEILDLPANKVRVIAAYLGGGVGGKEDMTVETFIALLVGKTRRPVRMICGRPGAGPGRGAPPQLPAPGRRDPDRGDPGHRGRGRRDAPPGARRPRRPERAVGGGPAHRPRVRLQHAALRAHDLVPRPRRGLAHPPGRRLPADPFRGHRPRRRPGGEPGPDRLGAARRPARRH